MRQYGKVQTILGFVRRAILVFDRVYTGPGIHSHGGNMVRICICIVLFVLSANPANADAQPMRNPSRGELLYTTHCIACHSTRVHWRDKRLAKNWASLRAQVDHWQKFSGLAWGREDVAAVAQYLNALYYHYPAP